MTNKFRKVMSLAVMVLAVMVMLCGRHGCGRYGHPLWPNRPIWFVAEMVVADMVMLCGRCGLWPIWLWPIWSSLWPIWFVADMVEPGLTRINSEKVSWKEKVKVLILYVILLILQL